MLYEVAVMQSFAPQTHAIVDFTCAAEKNGTAVEHGGGIPVFLLMEGKTAKPSDVFDFLSKLYFICNCYHLSTDSHLGVICRRTITKCPYKKTAPVDVSITTLA